MKELPIPQLDGPKAKGKTYHDRIVAAVEQIVSLRDRVDAVKVPYDRTAIHRQLAAAERKVDELVYEMYGLSEDEIQVIETRGTGKFASSEAQD